MVYPNTNLPTLLLTSLLIGISSFLSCLRFTNIYEVLTMYKHCAGDLV